MASKTPMGLAPQTPAAVSIMIEGGKYVFRTDDSHCIYVSDADKPGQSLCEGACAVQWKPVPAPSAARATGDWTVVTRKDSYKQWAYKGRPVYTFAGDTSPVPKGDGVDGVWHVLNP